MKQVKNNKPFLAYRSFYMPLNTIKQFSNAGYDTICVFPAHTNNSLGTPYSQYPPTWLWYDKIDFTPFDKMIEDIGNKMPDVKILCMIDLNSPCWLEHQLWNSCSDTFNNLGKAVHSSDWLNATEWYLKKFLEYASEHYSDKILAYILACGGTDEWYDYSNGTDSQDRNEAWKKWQISENCTEIADIPSISVREHYSHENFLRDPIKDKTAIDYWKFCNSSIADTILRFASITRKIVGTKPEIGCFYGYILEKELKTLVSCGHLEYEKVLDSNDIDFLISPGTYKDREMGGGSGFLIPAGTARIRGKRLLHECDQRTHTSNNYLTADISLQLTTAWKDEKSTVAGIKRETSLGILNGTHLWWFDMWGDFYQGEAVMNTLSKSKELWEKYNYNVLTDMSEVALIVDPQSTYLVNQEHPRVCEMNRSTRIKLNRLGASFDVYSFNDISKIKNFKRYKFVIFTSMFYVTPEREKILNKYVLCDNRYVLWLYAPGIYLNGSFDIKNCEKFTGIPYKSEELCVKKMEGWTSCYLYDYESLTPKILKELAKSSGVCMTTEKEIPVYANSDMLMVHTAEGGNIELTVNNKYKKATELYTQKSFDIENSSFIYPFSSPDTALFLLSL